MREVPITKHASLPLKVFDRLASELRDRRTLADVLAWGRAQTPPRSVTEILTQDEYTHDVLVAYDEAVYLVFDTT
jgi:hypothetical protein